MDTKVKERAEPTSHTKPILGRRGRLCDHVNTKFSYYEGILVSRWKVAVEEEPELQVSELEPAEMRLVPEYPSNMAQTMPESIVQEQFKRYL